MEQREPDPFPTQWSYSLVRNFSHNGIDATWARGSPRAWHTADSVVSPSQGCQFSRMALDPTGTYLAAGDADNVSIFEIQDNGVQERFGFKPELGSGTLDHLEWSEHKNDTGVSKTSLLVVSIQTLQPGRRRKAYVGVFKFNDDTTSIEPVQDWGCLPWPLRSSNMLDPLGHKLLILENPEAEASGTDRNGNVEIWSWQDQRRLSSLNVRSDDVSWLSFSPNGRLVAVADKDRILRLFDAVSGVLHSSTSSLIEPQINGGAFSPDGRLIALSCSAFHADAAAVRLFDVDGHNTLNLPFQPMARSLAWSSDGMWLAYGAQGGYLSISEITRDPVPSAITLQTWHLDYPGVRPSPLNEPAAVQFVDGDSKLLFATGMEGGVELYDSSANVKHRFEPGAEQADFQLGSMRSSIAWSQKWKMVVCLDGDGCVRLWRI